MSTWRPHVLLLPLCSTTLVGCIACVSHQADGGDARIGNGTGFLFAISNVPGGTSLGVGIFAILTLFSTLGLWGFHFRLIWIGQTTNELLRGTYRRRINPFNRGCVDNFAVMLCADSPARYVEWACLPAAPASWRVLACVLACLLLRVVSVV